MRWRVLFFISFGANLILAALWMASARRSHSEPPGAALEPASRTQTRTNIVIHRQFFSWDELESQDYPTYIANLREIGCPEQTIRDIIIAEINALFAKRRSTEVVTPEQQWWRSRPDTNVALLAEAKSEVLEQERRALLTRLLGPDWESGDLVGLPRPTRPGIALDGPILGILPLDTKQVLQDISVRAQDRLEAYVEAQRQAGEPVDPAEVARIREQTRDELARVLTPAQLEEYLLRYSQNANALRNELGQIAYFNATPEEFRGLFRATDEINQKLELLAGRTDPNSVLHRRNLEQQRENAIKQALGAERYEQYRLLHDPLYRDAVAAAQQAGTPEATTLLYQINQARVQQESAIRANTNLTAQQLQIELKRLELDQLQANALALGQEIPDDGPPLPPTIQQQPVSIPTHRHVLNVGESVASVALRYGVSVRDIRAANPDVNLRRLRAGDAIQVPRTWEMPDQAR